MKKSARAFLPRKRTVVLDAGPLKAVCDPGDPDHAWARSALRRLPARFVTCEAAIAEALHALDNAAGAVAVLREICQRIEIIPMAAERLDDLLAEVAAWAPRMDLADACAVLLVRSHANAFVLTVDFRDFSTYRVPFASPEGAFYVE